METQMDKTTFIVTLINKRAEWDTLLAQVPADRITEPGVAGDWSIKDIIAHVAGYELWTADQIDGLLRGATQVVPSPSSPPEAEDEKLTIDQRNEVIYQAYRFRSLADIQAMARQSFQRVSAAIAALPEDALMERERYAWSGGRPLWDALAGNTFGHYDEHIPTIAAWLARPIAIMNEAHAVATGYVAIAGGRLYYEVAGTGHPLVLIHAGVADCRMWDEQFAAFAQRYRVIRYDTRGFGKTTSENVAFSNRQDIADLLKHLGVEKTYILGLSRGGHIAIDFTIEYPETVAALIAVAAGVSGYQPAATEAEVQTFTDYERLEAAKDVAALTDFEVHVWGDGPAQPAGRATQAVRDRLYDMIANNYRLHHEELQPRVLEPPAAERLGEIHVPTLVISGSLDFPSEVATMDYLAEQVVGAQKVVFPDTAHMVNMEQPARFNAVVLDFLEKI